MALLGASMMKNVTLCALIVLGAFFSGVKCIGQSCSSSSDCREWEKCCRRNSVGTCHFDTDTCLGDYCASNTQCPRNAVCCGLRCVPGNNCIDRSCELQSECGFDESCCDDVCVYGKDCSGKGCSENFDCSGGQVCCSHKCTNGTNCIGRSCSTFSDCQTSEECCGGTCKGSKCNNDADNNGIIIGVAATGVVAVIFVVVFFFYNRRRQQRLMVFSNVPFEHFTESTTTHLPQPANNTFQLDQQPPPEYTARVTPPQYTLTSSYGSGGMNVTQKASLTSPHHQ